MPSRPDASAEPTGAAAVPPSFEADFAALMPSYAVPAGHFDELRDDGRALRPHWQSFVAQVHDVRAQHLSQMHAQVARQIDENGVTYNVYAGSDGLSRPWAVDVLPMVIPAAEWDPLADGLRQRARLMNALAADFYGEQRLFSEGLIPPALVFEHPGFLRPCHGVAPPNGVFVHQIAFDLARAPDGSWRVIGTRAQAPSGAGYALENRLTVSRLFPDAFRELRVHMLAQFFRTLQMTLLETAPCEGESPHVALLTPGPYSETYFEHAYLARYLGFTLVEGGDLTVRDDRVFLKTVSGLRRVHAILRRLDDDFCDPLELRAASRLGVPGLVQAWRAGNVVVANAFGTSVLESPALHGFLPPACERVLGESLTLPSIATWWCGEAAALEDATPRMADMVIKPAFPDLRMEPVFVADLDAAAHAEWALRLRASPERYVLQEYLPLSHAPVWEGGKLESRALMLRAFVVGDGRGDYRVMPGGLSRIAGDERHVVSGQRGGSSKDTWVLSDTPIEGFSLLPGKLGEDDVARSRRAVSSRAAESLFWLGRYAERSENCARLLRAVLSRLPYSDALPAGLYETFIRACRRHGLLHTESFGAPRRLERALISRMFDRRKSWSLAFGIERMLRVSAAVRDRLSADHWRVVNHLFEAFASAPQRTGRLAEALERLDDAIVSLVAIGGLEMQCMTRDEGWRFLSIGRYIERLLYVSTVVAEAAASGDAEQPALLEWLLDLADSIITYRARYMRQPEWLPVADLLVFDQRNPRSAAFQLAKLAKHVRVLPEADLADILAEVASTRVACRAPDATARHLSADPRAVEGFLHSCERLALRLSDALTLRYFSHVYEPTRATAEI